LNYIGKKSANLSATDFSSLYDSFVKINSAARGLQETDFESWLTSTGKKISDLSANDLSSLYSSFVTLKAAVDHASHGSGLSEFNDWLGQVGHSANDLSNGPLNALQNKFGQVKSSTDAASASLAKTHNGSIAAVHPPIQHLTAAPQAQTLATHLQSAVAKVFQVNFNIGGGKTVPLYGDYAHAGVMEQFLNQLAQGKMTAQGA